VSGTDERQVQIDAWRSVARGWERHRDVVWESTRAVSERLVALVDPRAGEHLLEVAAGAGDTGLLAAERLRPGGRLVSTDAAPEMVEAARRRARELEADDVELVVGDAAALPFAAASFDAALCRFGVMLVPDCDAAARELARVLRPGGVRPWRCGRRAFGTRGCRTWAERRSVWATSSDPTPRHRARSASRSPVACAQCSSAPV
jgi:ubiquinone/menaquinone biosynthesis C-methylase UbiE